MEQVTPGMGRAGIRHLGVSKHNVPACTLVQSSYKVTNRSPPPSKTPHLVPLTTPNFPPLPPHLPLFPLWPASLVCLGWLIIRDTKILLYPPLFSLHWNESLPWQRSGLGTTARRYPAIYCPFPPHKRGVWEGISDTHTHCNPATRSPTTQERDKNPNTHTHFLAWFGASDRTQNTFSLDWCLLSSLRAVSLRASEVSVFRDVPPGAGQIYVPFLKFFFPPDHTRDKLQNTKTVSWWKQIQRVPNGVRVARENVCFHTEAAISLKFETIFLRNHSIKNVSHKNKKC